MNGFAVVEYRATRAAEILWIGVRHHQRNQGVGATLLEHVLGALAADYEPYVATRAFWERHGFVHLDTIDPLPEWPPGNPAAITCAP